MGEKAFHYKQAGFDPDTLAIEEVALLMLMRRLKYGTIEALSIHQGKPSVIKNAVQRLELSNRNEAEAIIAGATALVKDPDKS